MFHLPQIHPSRRVRRSLIVLAAMLLVLSSLGTREAVLQRREDLYVHSVAAKVIDEARATDVRSKMLALRDYLRTYVSPIGFHSKGRVFLRDSAADTLLSGRGKCGEVTRAFINMADGVGIRAERIYLDGQRQHVVAAVMPEDGERILVDPSASPSIPELETLEQAMTHSEFDSFYTLNLRRLHIKRFSFRASLGVFNYWLENPHALKSLLWFSTALSVLLAMAAALKFRSLRLQSQDAPTEINSQVFQPT